MVSLARCSILILLAGCGSITEPDPNPNPDEVGSLGVTVTESTSILRTGDILVIDVQVSRDDGADGPVTVVAEGPSGITLAPAAIPADQAEARLVLTASPDAGHGQFPITLTATTDRGATGSAEFPLTVGGAPGELDLSFADGGQLVYGSNETGRGIASADGDILVGGSDLAAKLVRILPDGSFDPGWGTAGAVTIAVGNLAQCLRPLVASSGKIYCAGGADPADGSSDPAIFAFNPDGSPDTSFDTDGVQTTDLGSSYAESIVLVEADNGDLIAAGNFFLAPTDTIGFRTTAAGALVGGYNISDDAAVQAGLINANNQLVLAGVEGGQWWLKRYSPNSGPDNSFGVGGAVQGPSGAAHGLVENGTGLIVVGISDSVVASAAYDSAGDPVPEYGQDGVNVTGLALGTRGINAAVRDDQGRILFVGHDQWQPAVVRLLPSGYPDSSFGVGGKVLLETNEPLEVGKSGSFGVAIDPLGRVLVVATVGNSGGERVLVARLWP